MDWFLYGRDRHEGVNMLRLNIEERWSETRTELRSEGHGEGHEALSFEENIEQL